MKASKYRNGKIPGRRGYGIDDEELKRLFGTDMFIIEIAKQMNVSQWTVLDHLKKLGLHRNQRHLITNQDAFTAVNEKNSYWSGFLAADGCILSGRNGVEVELAIKDANHLKKLCQFVGRDETLSYREREKDGKIFKYVSVCFASKVLVADLIKNFNVVPKKSLILQPPTNLPQHLLSHFIRGYFDGDGSVGWHKYNKSIRLSFCCGSEKFLKWVWDMLCKELGDIGNRKITTSKKSNTKTFGLSGDVAIRVLEWMYQDCDEGFYLDRKLATFKSFRDRLYENRAIKTVKRQNMVQEMIDLYKQGMSYREIAEALEVTPEKVSYYMRETNISKLSKKTESVAGRKLQARDQEILSAYLVGETAEILATKYGICRQSIWAAIRRTKNLNDISQNT